MKKQTNNNLPLGGLEPLNLQPKKKKKDNSPQKPNNGIQKAQKGGTTSIYGQPYVGNEVFNTKAFPNY